MIAPLVAAFVIGFAIVVAPSLRLLLWGRDETTLLLCWGTVAGAAVVGFISFVAAVR